MSKHQSTWILVVVLLMLTGCTSPGTPNGVSVSTRQPTNIPTATSTSIPSIPTVGPAPAWAAWPPGPNVFQEGPITNSSPYDPGHGWDMTKVVWEVGPNYTQSITIQGQEVSNHTPVSLQFGNDSPTAQAVLDPQHPSHPRSVLGDGWAEWGSYIVVPKAGCYSLEVSWPAGHWTVTFAFGA